MHSYTSVLMFFLIFELWHLADNNVGSGLDMGADQQGAVFLLCGATGGGNLRNLNVVQHT